MLIAASGLVATGLAGCLGDDDGNGDVQGDGEVNGGLVITDHHMDEPDHDRGNFIVEGTAETDAPVSFTGVVAAFYDEDGDELNWRGVAEREDGLEGGETWEFSINPGFTPEHGVDDYEVGITDDEGEFEQAGAVGADIP